MDVGPLTFKAFNKAFSNSKVTSHIYLLLERPKCVAKGYIKIENALSFPDLEHTYIKYMTGTQFFYHSFVYCIS